MKVLNYLSVAVLSVVLLACGQQAETEEVSNEPAPAPVKKEVKKADQKLPIGIVNTDTVIAKYQFAVDADKRLKSKQTSATNEMNAKAKALENDMIAFQNKYESNGFTSREQFENAQLAIEKKKNALAQLNDKYTEQLLNEQEKLTLQLRDSLQNYLKEMNKTGKYEMIIQNSTTNETVLYSKPGYDITNQVIEGLNKRYTKK